MSNCCRANAKGAMYFFAVVTYRRQKFFSLPENRNALRNAIVAAKLRYPFNIEVRKGHSLLTYSEFYSENDLK